MKGILDNSAITVFPFPDDVMPVSKDVSEELFNELKGQDANFASVFEDWEEFRKESYAWMGSTELAMLQTSSLQV